MGKDMSRDDYAALNEHDEDKGHYSKEVSSDLI